MARPNNHLARIAVYSQDRVPFRTITRIQALQLISSEDAVPMTSDASGELPGWRERKDYNFRAVMLCVTPGKSKNQSSISLSEMQANACGHSITRGLSDRRRQQINAERAERGLRPLPDEDFTEQAMNKIDAWPTVYDTKAVVVVPRTASMAG